MIGPRGIGKLVGRAAEAVHRRGWELYWRARPGADGEVFELRPFHLQLEFTNLCNANCVFCPYSQQVRPHQRMPDRIFKKAVADYVAMGGGSVDLTPTVGDALIHPKFVERVRYLRSIPQIDRITLTTNGILLDRHGVDAVLGSGLSRINISLAGFDEEMYARVYRSPAYKKVLKNVTSLLEANARREKPVTIYLCFRPDRPKDEVLAAPDLKALLRHHPKISFVTLFSRSGGKITELPPGMELIAPVTEAKTEPCRATYTTLLVQSSGDVQVCACEASVNAPALVIGNIERDSLIDIWRGQRLRELRDSFRNGCLNANCAKCDYSYAPPDFHVPAMRRMARDTRRRLAGETVRHDAPITHDWQME
jgi:radical SAM protein with 4Fe4S-binding SPASM domain